MKTIVSSIRAIRRRRQIRHLANEYEALAISFGWDATSAWVQDGKQQLLNRVHGAQSFAIIESRTKRSLSPHNYARSRDTAILAGFHSDLNDPDPLEVARLAFGIDLRGADRIRVAQARVSSNVTRLYDKDGTLICAFVGYGRVQSDSRNIEARNVSSLLGALYSTPTSAAEFALEKRIPYQNPAITLEVRDGQFIEVHTPHV